MICFNWLKTRSFHSNNDSSKSPGEFHRRWFIGDTRDIIDDNVKYYFNKNCWSVIQSQKLNLSNAVILYSRLNDLEMIGILSNDFDPFFKIELNLANFEFFWNFDSSQNQNDFNQLQMAIIEIIRKLFLKIHPFWWFSWMFMNIFISLTVLTSFISVTFKWQNLISVIN